MRQRRVRFLGAVGLLLTAVLAACGGGSAAPARSGAPTRPVAMLPPAPEPAVAPPMRVRPAGHVTEVGSPVEGVVADGRTRTVVAAFRDRRLALLDDSTGRLEGVVGVPGTARHLQLVADGGPVLVPGEDTDLLVQVGLPRGQVVATTRVGRQPHDAAADPASGRIVVTDELGSAVSIVSGDRVLATLSGPVQPGGVAIAGGRAGVVDVRSAQLFIYDVAQAREIGRLPAGNGPTHAVPIGGARVLVADTRGDALLVYDLSGTPRQLGRLPQPGSPYGIAYDAARSRLYVALSADNQVLRFDVGRDGSLHRVGPALPTVRQPNSLAVDPLSGTLFVGSATSPGQVQVAPPPAG